MADVKPLEQKNHAVSLDTTKHTVSTGFPHVPFFSDSRKRLQPRVRLFSTIDQTDIRVLRAENGSQGQHDYVSSGAFLHLQSWVAPAYAGRQHRVTEGSPFVSRMSHRRGAGVLKWGLWPSF